MSVEYIEMPYDSSGGAIIRKAVRRDVSGLTLDDFVLKYSYYYRNARTPPRVTGDMSQFKKWLREIKEKGGSGFFHISCIDGVSTCMHYYNGGGKEYAALYGHRLVKP